MLQLIPQPKHIELGNGTFAPGDPIFVHLPTRADAGTKIALYALMAELRSASQLPVYPIHQNTIAAIRCILKQRSQNDSYELHIHKNGIDVIGMGSPGLFYGIQTLRQLVRLYGTAIPCCAIRDQPAFRHRAFYLDISRGRVPRLDTLRQIVDLLAYLKYNQLQLYVEHVFPFAFDPSISEIGDVLTPHELRSLDEFCRARHIQLVPSLACFGHMGRVLSLPAYRHLAERPTRARSWEKTPWIQRLRGVTINPCHPQARKLLRAMLREFLPCFSTDLFNMCGDETYDLGRGSNQEWVERHGMANLYALHVRFLHDEAARHGKRLMLWGDMLHKYPDAIRQLPSDCIVLDWGYEPDTPYSKVRRFTNAGLDAYVCPSTRGYRVVFNEVEKARANISGYSREGARAGASGLMITDWGDMGHFNLPAASLHGLALGAAMAWNPHGDSGLEFDRAFSLQLFGDSTHHIARAFRHAGSAPVVAWPLMLTDLPDEWRTPESIEKALETIAIAEACQAVFSRLRLRPSPSPRPTAVADELLLACRAMQLTAEKVKRFAKNTRPTPKVRNDWANAVEAFFADYATVWQQHYKPLGLRDLRRAFARAVRCAREGKNFPTRLELP